MDHDAQLQDQLGGRLKEGFQEAEHSDVSTLEHEPPVEVAARSAAVPAALSTQVEGMNVPEEQRQGQFYNGTR